MIVISEAYDHVTVACLYVNSNLNLKVFPTEELQDLNPKLGAEGREYLEHDSHVDCTRLHIYKKTALLETLGDDQTRLLGCLSMEDLMLTKKLISSARTIAAGVKKKYGLFF